MSSAALQTAVPALSGTSPAHSPSREEYYAQREHPNASASPASSRRPSRRPSANSAHPDSSHMASSPVNAAMASSPDSASRRRHDAPVAPPRTSSSRHDSPSGSSPRRSARAEERAAADSPRRTAVENSTRAAAATTNGRSDLYDEPSSRSRRAVSQHVGYEVTHRPASSSREHRQTIDPNSLPIRPHESRQPSHEASEVLNRVVVSQPEVDVQREQERLEEAQPVSSRQTHQAYDDTDDAIPPPIAMHQNHDDTRRSGRSRQDHSKNQKASRFGEFYLGNTIGEGEFGKVKLGWKQDGGVQVAIKLIRRESVGNNPSRMAKIYREVHILRGISHPNIVRLHEMYETERHIGIVLEYASGGELFDYILNHRYLKDQAARRLFAQLVSGVGYLHKKGIVHRDLKLENLLLDRNRNIIITDFGFANTFDPVDELTEEEEVNLSDRDYIKRVGLDRTKANGLRRGDLMQTSCGSPCYAAPELVVSDSLYTGRKVDVWSCGVILYAMLAGYLPFDDDPANPEGDNINLLYKYIVNTPLTFPEYVTPHARDLLRRILVPSPRKRADLFEVARHSWLSEYSHVVELITSTTTTSSEIANTTVPAEDSETSGLARSASVREPTKAKPAPAPAPAVNDARKQGKAEMDEAAYAKAAREKRRTVQVEYVAPNTQTQRGSDPAEARTASRGKTGARSSSQGPAETRVSPNEKPLPRDPPVPKEGYSGSPNNRKPPSAHRNYTTMPPPSRGSSTRIAAVESPYANQGSAASVARPNTGGSINSTGSRGLGTRTSYGQPLPPAVVDTNVRGSIQQPKVGAKNYVISNPMPQDQASPEFARPSSGVPNKFAQMSGFDQNQQQPQPRPVRPSGEGKGHRRSNTLGEIGSKIFGRSGSILGGNRKKRPDSQQAESHPRKYPPVSMSNALPTDSRTSMDSRTSRRSFSIGLSKKRSGSVTGSQDSNEGRPRTRRFSLMKAIGLAKDDEATPETSQGDLPIQEPPSQVDDYGRFIPPQSRGAPTSPYGNYEQQAPQSSQPRSRPASQKPTPPQSNHRRFASGSKPTAIPSYLQTGAVLNTGSDSSFEQGPSQGQREATNPGPYQNSSGYEAGQYDEAERNGPSLQKNRRFVDAYDEAEYGRPYDHSGSSGPAKKVMDFFRRRGRARGGDA